MNLSSVVKSLFDTELLDYNRLLKLSTPLGCNCLLVQRIVAKESIGIPFCFTIDCISQQYDLDLKRLLAQPVTLSVLQADGSYHHFHAIVSNGIFLGNDGGVSDYQLELKPWISLLEHVTDSRIFQDLTAVEIVTQVLECYSFSEGGFRFDLRHQEHYPKRSYCVQYRETSYNFINRLLEEEGIWWYVVHEADKHVIVFTDDNDTSPAVSPQIIRFHSQAATEKFDSVTDWGCSQRIESTRIALSSFDYKAPGTPQRVQLDAIKHSQLPVLEQYDYLGEYAFNCYDRGQQLSETLMEAYEAKSECFVGEGGARQLKVGHQFILSQHPSHDNGGTEQRTFLLVGLQWAAENNLPISVTRRQIPGSLEEQVQVLRQAMGFNLHEVSEQQSAGTAFFHVRLEAQYLHVPYRIPMRHAKAEVSGPQTAIVVGPANETIHTDMLNRVKVQFHWDRCGRYTEDSGCWLRVSQANADGGWGAVFVPRIGQEVIVSFLEGDPDRPIITGRVYNGERTPLWHSNGLLSGFHTQNYRSSGYNELVFDDATDQSRIRLSTDQQHSQLNLGYLIHQNGNGRGAFRGLGFELRSDAYGAVRANKGLYLSSWGQLDADGDQFDIDPTQQQLTRTRQMNERLTDLASRHNADKLTSLVSLGSALKENNGTLAGHDSKQGGQGEACGMQAPWLHIASPAGISLTTPKSTHLAQEEHLSLSSGQDTTIATGKSLLASITEKLSLFVYNAGIKLFAAKGDIDVQAQSDSINLTAKQNINLQAANGKITEVASDEITFASGGAYIRLKGGNIELHAPGAIDVKGAQQLFDGPSSMNSILSRLPNSLPVMPDGICVECMLRNLKRGVPFVDVT